MQRLLPQVSRNLAQPVTKMFLLIRLIILEYIIADACMLKRDMASLFPISKMICSHL